MNTEKETTILFLHIPKTAGTTLYKVIERQYDASSVFTNRHFSAAKLGVKAQKVPFNQRWEIVRDILKKLPDSEKENIKVIQGHMGFGWHKLLPQPCRYITLLREPAETVISQYFHFLRREEGHYLRDQIIIRKMGVKDYACSGINLLTDNGQTRLISGIWNKVGFGECTTEHLDIAKENLLTHFSVVGLTEEFDKTMILLKRQFGWRLPLYRKQNVGKNHLLKKEIPEDDLRAIEKINELDSALYLYAKKIFAKLVAQQGASFDKELRLFQFVNTFYSLYSSRNSIIKLAPEPLKGLCKRLVFCL